MACSEQPITRVQLAGKFFELGGPGAGKFYVKGFSYGPFAPNSRGEPLPEPEQLRRDFAHIRALGANTVRVYFPPPLWLLDEALEQGLFVFIDIPWEKHRCFFEDWFALERARDRVRQTARELGNHPAVFALSVVNEFPVDVVRFYGCKRVEKLVEELIAIAKAAAPKCLVTFVNYPTTEFLSVNGCDFTCFNVYLHDEQDFARYLDRLQHIAGNKPLVLGEYGIDSKREGEPEQAKLIGRHIKQVFRHGLAGSVVFAYTDDWFTGGHQIEDWFFGATRSDRSEKLVASDLRNLWSNLPTAIEEPLVDTPIEHPKVSVVVCTYNGGRTLRGCLKSLMVLDYPNFEVIVVDDGSSDATARITAQFPQVIYHYQENRGLSVARNVGASLASGEIVAYTDDDCLVDVHWLRYLVQALCDQQVAAIGGPNLPPPCDSWIAKCVAASPGGPSHVMLDDRYAEHVPGCNLAFYRDELFDVGGFDPQFRQAGDDVDICWRLIDAGKKIGYAPGAMVWHHRRCSVGAYVKQQKGYGRSEAMVHFKHPGRFDALGKSNWKGVIYGDGAVGLPSLPPLIYHGVLGAAPFQTIYRQNCYGLSAWFSSVEWQLVALFVLALGVLLPPFVAVAALMWVASLVTTIRAASAAPLPPGAPWWCRPLVCWLYFIQPLVRGWTRHTHLLSHRKLPPRCPIEQPKHFDFKKVTASSWDLYWDDHQARGREQLLAALTDGTRKANWSGDFEDSWSTSDMKLVGDRWHEIEIRTASEELGWPRRFTRARSNAIPTLFCSVVVYATAIWTVAALISMQTWALGLAGLMASIWLQCITTSRKKCLQASTEFVASAGSAAGLGTAQNDQLLFQSETAEVQNVYAVSPIEGVTDADESKVVEAGRR